MMTNRFGTMSYAVVVLASFATFGGLALCGAAPARAEAWLYFADIFNPTFNDGFVKLTDTQGGGATTILTVGGGLRGVALDTSVSVIYWSDVSGRKIRRAGLDGSYPQDVITTGLVWPMAIAVAPAADWVFWGDQVTEQIGRAHRDGSDAAPLILTPFGSGLAVDTLQAKVYWTTALSGESGTIERANYDGTGIETVVAGFDKPARLALDMVGGKVYWTDYVVDVVRRANLDGSNVETLYAVGANHNPGGIVVDRAAGKVYWGQDVNEGPYVGKIMRMDLDGSNPEDVLTGLGMVNDLAFFSVGSLGDLNCDGIWDFDDINPFVLALSDPEGYAATYPGCDIMNADCNRDGVINFDDIDAFVQPPP